MTTMKFVSKPNTIEAVLYIGGKDNHAEIRQHTTINGKVGDNEPADITYFVTKNQGAQVWNQAKQGQEWSSDVQAAVWNNLHENWLPVRKGDWLNVTDVNDIYTIHQDNLNANFFLEPEINEDDEDTGEELPLSFSRELESLINRHSVESHSDTPDFILALFVGNALDAFQTAVSQRDKWYGFALWDRKETTHSLDVTDTRDLADDEVPNVFKEALSEATGAASDGLAGDLARDTGVKSSPSVESPGLKRGEKRKEERDHKGRRVVRKK